jgi:hypothetical protein
VKEREEREELALHDEGNLKSKVNLISHVNLKKKTTIESPDNAIYMDT